MHILSVRFLQDRPSAEADAGWGGKLNGHLMASCVMNMCTKNYWNCITLFSNYDEENFGVFLCPTVCIIIIGYDVSSLHISRYIASAARSSVCRLRLLAKKPPHEYSHVLTFLLLTVWVYLFQTPVASSDRRMIDIAECKMTVQSHPRLIFLYLKRRMRFHVNDQRWDTATY